MKLFKFASWYWTIYLDNNDARFTVVFMIWVVFFVLATVLSLFLATGTILGYYVLVSVMALLGLGIYHLILYIRDRYIEWQERTGQ